MPNLSGGVGGSLSINVVPVVTEDKLRCDLRGDTRTFRFGRGRGSPGVESDGRPADVGKGRRDILRRLLSDCGALPSFLPMVRLFMIGRKNQAKRDGDTFSGICVSDETEGRLSAPCPSEAQCCDDPWL